MSRITALSRGLCSCHLCSKVASMKLHECPRCGAPMHSRKPDSVNRTLALTITACILYIPANIFPIMITDQLSGSLESTILGGVVLLINLDSFLVAGIIFVFSVMVPIGKLLVLFYLCHTLKRGSSVSSYQRTIAYRITEFIGKWSMVDVFVVAILTALVHIGTILVIRPGIAAISFAGLVFVTMLAAESLDPRLFWDQEENVNHD